MANSRLDNIRDVSYNARPVVPWLHRVMCFFTLHDVQLYTSEYTENMIHQWGRSRSHSIALVTGPYPGRGGGPSRLPD